MDPRLAWFVPGAASVTLVLWGLGDARAQQPTSADEPPPPAVSIATPQRSALGGRAGAHSPRTPQMGRGHRGAEAPAGPRESTASARSSEADPQPRCCPKGARQGHSRDYEIEAPVGRRVRYKTLIFTVKVCETRDVGDAQPRPSAYLVIDPRPGAPPGRPVPPAKEVFRGWIFANRPGLNPFEHPVYDAWLDVCADAPAPA